MLPWIPKRGEAISIDFNPKSGHEQAGRRPALVLSPSAYNQRTNLVVVCPITGQAKGYPFEVDVPADLPVYGVVLADHVKSLDWRERKASHICTLPDTVLESVLLKLNALLDANTPD